MMDRVLPVSTPHYKHTEACIVPLSTLAESKYHKPFARPDGVILTHDGMWAEYACSVVGVPIFHFGEPPKR
jgi:hypothetical protein